MESINNQSINALLVLAIVAIVSGCSGGGNNSSSIESNATGAGASNFEMLETMRQETGLTRDFALAQFVAYFGPIEGAPELTPDNSMPIFATHAITDLLRFEDELDPALLDAVYQRIIPVGSVSSVGAGSNTSRQSKKTDPALEAKTSDIAVAMGELIGEPLERDIEVVRISSIDIMGFSNDDLRVFVVPINTRYQLVNNGLLSVDALGIKSPESCWIVINEGTSSTPFDEYEEARKEMSLAHEVAHCFQEQFNSLELPGWVIEGSASWAGEEFVGGTDVFDGLWEIYEQPEYDLFSAFPYSAIGFWSHVSNAVPGSLWKRLPMIHSDSTKDSAGALDAVVKQLGSEGYASWPTGGAMKPEWGAQWESIGVGGRNVAKIPQPIVGKTTASYGETKLLSVERTSGTSDSMILKVISNGVGLMHWSDSGESIEFGTLASINYCWTGDCLCENTVPPAGYENIPFAPANEDLIIAMTGQADQTDSTVDVVFLKVDEVCPTAPVPVLSGQDRCMVGKWFLDLDLMAEQLSTDENGQVVDPGIISGEVSVDLSADGSGSGFFDFSIFFSAVPGEATTVSTFKGSSTFSWRTTENNYLINYQSSVLDSSVVISVDGVENTFFPDNPQINNQDLFGPDDQRVATYTCTGDTLLISSEGPDAYDVRYLRSPDQ